MMQIMWIWTTYFLIKLPKIEKNYCVLQISTLAN